MYTSKDNYIAKDEHARSAASEFILSDRDLFNLRPTGQVIYYTYIYIYIYIFFFFFFFFFFFLKKKEI